MLNIVVTFFAIVGLFVWSLVGYGFWRYATFMASGFRGTIFNPSDDTSNPFVIIGIIVWCIFWPLLALIERSSWGEVDPDLFLSWATDYKPLLHIFGRRDDNET